MNQLWLQIGIIAGSMAAGGLLALGCSATLRAMQDAELHAKYRIALRRARKEGFSEGVNAQRRLRGVDPELVASGLN